MSRPGIRVTDHAVLRYLERAEGVDVEGMRRTLKRRLEAALRDAPPGVNGVKIDGLLYRLSPEGSVVTCTHGSRPARGHCGPKRKRALE